MSKDTNEHMHAIFPYRVALRFVLYTLAIGFVAVMLPLLVQHVGMDGFFAERGPVEITQTLLLLAMIAVYLLYARTSPQYRELSIMLAAVCLFAALRELDFALDHMIPVIGWKIAGIIPLGIAGLMFCRWQRIQPQIHAFANTRAFALLWSGFITVVIIAQLLGTTSLFQAMMGENYERFYKRVIEESAELLGYVILFCGTIEYGFCLAPTRAAAAGTNAPE